MNLRPGSHDSRAFRRTSDPDPVRVPHLRSGMTKTRGGNVADLVESPAVPDILRRPYLLTTVILVVIAVSIASSAVAAALGFPQETVEIFAEAALACIAAVVLTRFRLWRTVGFRALAPRGLRLYWVPLFPVLVMVPSVASRVGDIGLKQVGFYLILAALVGFTEEVAFRGMILQSISPRGPWLAAIISAGLFGLMHSLNMFAGADPTGTGIQVIYASAVGFCFAAITLRTGAIWPLVIIHGLTDFAGFTTAGSTIPGAVSSADLLIYSTYIVLFAGYGVILMRQTNPPTAPSRTDPSPR